MIDVLTVMQINTKVINKIFMADDGLFLCVGGGAQFLVCLLLRANSWFQ